MKACSLLINMVPVTSSLDFMRNCRVDFPPNIVGITGISTAGRGALEGFP